MTGYYLDSSVVLHALLRTNPAAGEWLEQVSADDQTQLVSSRILRTELTRVLRREGLPVTIRDAVLVRIDLVPVTDSVLSTAEAIVPLIPTLDAIHLATAVTYGSDLVVVTHDRRMTDVATVMGYRTLDPVSSR